MLLRLIIQTSIFIGAFFVALPAAFFALNDQLGWPRWDSDLGEAIGIPVHRFWCGGILLLLWTLPAFGAWETPAAHPHGRLRSLPVVAKSDVCRLHRYRARHLPDRGSLRPAALFRSMLPLGRDLPDRGGKSPPLNKRFGADYQEYQRRVPRWIGRPGVADDHHVSSLVPSPGPPRALPLWIAPVGAW